MRKDLVLIEIPLPQVTEHDDQLLHSEASQPGVTLLSSNMAEKIKVYNSKHYCFSLCMMIKSLYGLSIVNSPLDMQALHIIRIKWQKVCGNAVPSLNFLIPVLLKTTILSLIWNPVFKKFNFPSLLFIMYLKSKELNSWMYYALVCKRGSLGIRVNLLKEQYAKKQRHNKAVGTVGYRGTSPPSFWQII